MGRRGRQANRMRAEYWSLASTTSYYEVSGWIKPWRIVYEAEARHGVVSIAEGGWP